MSISAVVDRWVQQTLCPLLEVKIDPNFSDSTSASRPGRGADDELRRASQYVAESRVSVDMAKKIARERSN